MVGGHVADAVAAGLDRVHPDIGQRVQHVGHVAQLRPVELDVLARREMAVALVPGSGDHAPAAHLRAVQRAIGDRHPQHVGVKLQVEPVHQPQRLELVLALPAACARSAGVKSGSISRPKLIASVVAEHLWAFPTKRPMLWCQAETA
jgi:hypothetical protein